MRYKVITADQAAALIHNGDIVGFSGFTPAGAPSVVLLRSEERRVGKECRSRWSPYH